MGGGKVQKPGVEHYSPFPERRPLPAGRQGLRRFRGDPHAQSPHDATEQRYSLPQLHGGPFARRIRTPQQPLPGRQQCRGFALLLDVAAGIVQRHEDPGGFPVTRRHACLGALATGWRRRHPFSARQVSGKCLGAGRIRALRLPRAGCARRNAQGSDARWYAGNEQRGRNQLANGDGHGHQPGLRAVSKSFATGSRGACQ